MLLPDSVLEILNGYDQFVLVTTNTPTMVSGPDLRERDQGGRPGTSTKRKYNSQVLMRYLLLQNHEKLVSILVITRKNNEYT
jgi:hypothetical protein